MAKKKTQPTQSRVAALFSAAVNATKQKQNIWKPEMLDISRIIVVKNGVDQRLGEAMPTTIHAALNTWAPMRIELDGKSFSSVQAAIQYMKLGAIAQNDCSSFQAKEWATEQQTWLVAESAQGKASGQFLQELTRSDDWSRHQVYKSKVDCVKLGDALMQAFGMSDVVMAHMTNEPVYKDFHYGSLISLNKEIKVSETAQFRLAVGSFRDGALVETHAIVKNSRDGWIEEIYRRALHAMFVAVKVAQAKTEDEVENLEVDSDVLALFNEHLGEATQNNWPLFDDINDQRFRRAPLHNDAIAQALAKAGVAPKVIGNGLPINDGQGGWVDEKPLTGDTNQTSDSAEQPQSQEPEMTNDQ